MYLRSAHPPPAPHRRRRPTSKTETPQFPPRPERSTTAIPQIQRLRGDSDTRLSRQDEEAKGLSIREHQRRRWRPHTAAPARESRVPAKKALLAYSRADRFVARCAQGAMIER